MHEQSLTYEAECCKRLAAKLKREDERRLMLKVAKAFEDLAAEALGKPSAGDQGPVGTARTGTKAPRPAERHRIPIPPIRQP